jgi:hypothetical protein
MRTPTSRVAALALVSALTLAGCGGSDDDAPKSDPKSSASADKPADEPAADAAAGSKVEGTGYTYAVPEGWDVPTQEIPGTEQTDTFAADLTDADGFADNINVIRLDPAPMEELDKLEKALTAELETAGSKDVTVRDRADIAGDEAVHIASVQNQQGKSYLTEQYNAIHDGVSYVVTFSFSDTVSDADRDKVADSILASWTWTS